MDRIVQMVGVALAAALSSSCADVGGTSIGLSGYSLVRAQPRAVAGGHLMVTPPREWNRLNSRIFDDVRHVEDWTQNGMALDSLSFVDGLGNDKSLVRQYRSDDRQVPRFRSTMTAPEIAAMIESLFRVRAGTIDFRTTALVPRPFLGGDGFQLDFDHLDSDEVWRRGRAVGVVVEGRLFLIMLDAARSHYFTASLSDFEAIAASARRR